ncbi:aldo-keto reductase family 4 member c9-like protein [Trifolium pratense]|uniref:Aldo-keto reductase family 4 member c9-like protein n=1 Tax=Trifolium pratense TaxID=57577 RepID=A0A2K3M4L2_TRIPR|nr:aldo-keto reductase family 4 member c9-like protein [Trifolium pratense]
MDYLDLYLIHSQVSKENGHLTKPDIPSTWKAMEALCDDSHKARAIRVSNFSVKKLQDLLDVARVPPAVNQVEFHPSLQQLNLHAFYAVANAILSVPTFESVQQDKLIWNEDRDECYSVKSGYNVTMRIKEQGLPLTGPAINNLVQQCYLIFAAAKMCYSK